MNDQIRWDLLDRYFAGECAADEAQAISAWIAATPSGREQLEALRVVWRQAASRPDLRWNAPAAWDRLAATLDVPTTKIVPERLRVLPTTVSARSAGDRRRRPWIGIAAAAVLVAGAAALWRAVDGRPIAVGEVGAMRTYTAPRGQRVSLMLADGTRIVLAPGSTMRVPSDFARRARRDVHLDGEALFTVTHNARRPFVVHASYGTAEDLGTQFVVTAYRGDTAMRVVVAEGIVAVRGLANAATVHRSPRVLRAGDLATVGASGQVVDTRQVAVGDYLRWVSGQLVFRDTPLRDVLATLARWYNVDIQLGSGNDIDEAAARRVTLTTDPAQPLAEVLAAATLPTGLRARWIADDRVLVER